MLLLPAAISAITDPTNVSVTALSSDGKDLRQRPEQFQPKGPCVLRMPCGRLLEGDAGLLEDAARTRALGIRDRQALGEILTQWAGRVDTHLGEGKRLGIRRRIEDRALASRDEEDV